jgi:hypothetical protein
MTPGERQSVHEIILEQLEVGISPHTAVRIADAMVLHFTVLIDQLTRERDGARKLYDELTAALDERRTQ